MNFIGVKALLEMQNGDPRKLIRGSRRPLHFPWRPIERSESDAGQYLFITTASDLSIWYPADRRLLETPNTLVRLQRPGSLTQDEVMRLRGAEVIWIDCWCGDPSVCEQLLEAMLPELPAVNDYLM